MNHPNINAIKQFANEYDQFANNLLYHSYDKFYAATYGLFPIDWKKELEERFNVTL